MLFKGITKKPQSTWYKSFISTSWITSFICLMDQEMVLCWKTGSFTKQHHPNGKREQRSEWA